MDTRALRALALMLGLASLSRGLAAQDLAAIAGSWQGDKALGTVLIRPDGTGEVTFESDAELKMRISVIARDGQYAVSQAEPNQPAFYEAFGLPPAASATMAARARPMRWLFRLSPDGSRLAGRKETTSYKRGESGDVTDIKNDYVRDSSWARLTGKVAAPSASPAPGAYQAGQAIELSCATPGASIRYALDGATLSESAGQAYSGPIRLASGASLAAVAVKEGWQVSDVLKAEYRIASPGTSASEGTWNGFRVVLAGCFREGEAIVVELKAYNLRPETRRFYLYRGRTRIVDAEGEVYDRTEGFFSGRSGESSTAIGGDLPSEVPIKYAMKFSGAPPGLASIKLLELEVGDGLEAEVFAFKDLPVAPRR